jgi:hypothetical protein
MTGRLQPDLLDPLERFYVEAKQYKASARSDIIKGVRQVLDTVGRLRGGPYAVDEELRNSYRESPHWCGLSAAAALCARLLPSDGDYGTLLPPGLGTPPLVGISSPPLLPALYELPGSPPKQCSPSTNVMASLPLPLPALHLDVSGGGGGGGGHFSFFGSQGGGSPPANAPVDAPDSPAIAVTDATAITLRSRISMRYSLVVVVL